MSDITHIHASNEQGEAVRAIVVEDRGIGNMALNVDSVLNWPHKFIATIAEIDPSTGVIIDDTASVFFGYLDGSIMMISAFAPGYSDVGNFENQVVILKPTTAWADGVATALEDINYATVGAISGDGSSLAFWRGLPLGVHANGGSVTNMPEVYGVIRIAKISSGSLDVQYWGTSNDVYHVFIGNGASTMPTWNKLARASDIVGMVTATATATLTNKTLSTGSTIDANVTATEVLKKVYPVGSVYISSASTSPATLFGFGTWAAYGAGRTIFSKNTTGTFATAGATGGAENVTLTAAQMPSHTHIQNQHRHLSVISFGGSQSLDGYSSYSYNNVSRFYNPTNYVTATNQNTGGGGSHSNLPPYITCYMWERTA